MTIVAICHDDLILDTIYSKFQCSLSPNPVMVHMKFDKDWPKSFFIPKYSYPKL